jgi:hypothetical protein
VLERRNLIADLEPFCQLRDQRTPSVDSDGRQFVVAFDERGLPGASDPDVYVSVYDWADDTPSSSPRPRAATKACG